MPDPAVSILMPAFNCEKYIALAIEAVLIQTYQDFEFIIINDGSSDGTKKIIQNYTDERIVFIENEKNLGIVKTLNKGLAIAKGKYILRTDADDIAFPYMAFDLVNFMDTHDDYVACGANMKLIGSEKIFSYPSENKDLKIYTLSACPFSHSTVIFRKSVLDENNFFYNDFFKDGEDHGLWSTLLPFGKFHNLEKITLNYRESPTQVTNSKNYSKNYNNTRDKIFNFQAEAYFQLRHNDLKLYLLLINCRKAFNHEELDKAGKVMISVLEINKIKKLFDDQLLKKTLFIKWHYTCYNSYTLGKGVYKIYIKYAILSKNVLRLKSMAIHLFQFIKF